MERFLSAIKENNLKVYLIVDNDEVTHNVYATVGMALDAIAYNYHRLDPDLVLELSRTKLKWRDRQGNERFMEIRECPICNDVTLDYMSQPRKFSL